MPKNNNPGKVVEIELGNGQKIKAYVNAIPKQGSMHINKAMTGTHSPSEDQRHPTHIAKTSSDKVGTVILGLCIPIVCLRYGYSYVGDIDSCEKSAEYLLVAGWIGVTGCILTCCGLLQSWWHVTSGDSELSTGHMCTTCLTFLGGIFFYAWIIRGLCLLYGPEDFSSCPSQQILFMKLYIWISFILPLAAICCLGCVFCMAQGADKHNTSGVHEPSVQMA